jgi:hypothetical protein
MFADGVMTDAAAMHDVRLGRMQVAARRVDAKRPARRAELLPRRQSHRTAEEFANRFDGHWSRGHAAALEEGVVRRMRRQSAAREFYKGSAGIPAERVGLGGPVKPPERPREAGEMMLRLLVVPERNRHEVAQVAGS